MKEYLTVDGEARIEYETNKSVFIGAVKNINCFEEGIEFVKAERKRYSDATHVCYAFRLINNEQKFSDDGEPGGTAGQPILQVLKNKDINNAVISVTRYFGGIKLGAGGLVSAYTESAARALDKAKIVRMKLVSVGDVTVSYSESQSLLSKFQSALIAVTDISYGAEVTIGFGAGNTEQAEAIVADATSGRTKPVWKGQSYIKE